MSTRALKALLISASAVAGFPAMADSTLKPGPGRDTVEAACGTCHTPNYIRMNSPFLTPDQWKAEVTKMRTAYGAPIDDDAANEVLQYLGRFYAASPKR
jgi:mono/diheme cytochrome c family protein